MKKKDLKKLIIFIIIVIGIVVLSVMLKDKIIKNNTPESLTKDYLEKYIKLDKTVVDDISYPFADMLMKSVTENRIFIIVP